MRGNLESKFAAHGTEQLVLRGGQVGLEKHTKKDSLVRQNKIYISSPMHLGPVGRVILHRIFVLK